MDGRHFDDMMAFLAVAKVGSFSRAAEASASDRSSMSRRIAALENRLGVQLLTRSTRRVELTEAGHEYRLTCLAAVATLETAQDTVSALADVPRGLVRVTAPCTFGERYVAPLVGAFLQSAPKVQVDLHLTDDYVDLLADRVDFAIRIGPLADSSLKVRALFRNQRIFVAAPAYLSGRGSPKHPSDLVDHDCLVFTGYSEPDVWSAFSGSQSAQIPVSGSLRTNSAQSMLIACKAGLGIGHPALFACADDLQAGALVRVLPGWEGAANNVSIVHPPARRLAAKTRVFMEFIEQHLKPLGRRLSLM